MLIDEKALFEKGVQSTAQCGTACEEEVSFRSIDEGNIMARCLLFSHSIS